MGPGEAMVKLGFADLAEASINVTLGGWTLSSVTFQLGSSYRSPFSP
jgi:hypothetical protein